MPPKKKVALKRKNYGRPLAAARTMRSAVKARARKSGRIKR